MVTKEELFEIWFKEYGWSLTKEALDDKTMQKIAKETKKDLKAFKPYLWKAWEAGYIQRMGEDIL